MVRLTQKHIPFICVMLFLAMITAVVVLVKYTKSGDISFTPLMSSTEPGKTKSRDFGLFGREKSNPGISVTGETLMTYTIFKPASSCMEQANNDTALISGEKHYIPDINIKATNFYKNENRSGPWCARLGPPKSICEWGTSWLIDRIPFGDRVWIQVDLGDVFVINRVGTEGRQTCCLQYTKRYKLAYMNNQNLVFYFNSKEFQGSHNYTEHSLEPPIIAQVVRLYPLEGNKHNIGLRWELYGHNLTVCQ